MLRTRRHLEGVLSGPGRRRVRRARSTHDVDYGLPSIEPVAIIRPQGVKIKNYYTAYQGNIYGIAVPAESPIKSFDELPIPFRCVASEERRHVSGDGDIALVRQAEGDQPPPQARRTLIAQGGGEETVENDLLGFGPCEGGREGPADEARSSP